MHEVQQEADDGFACMETGMGLYKDIIHAGSDLFSLGDYDNYVNMDRDMLQDISSTYWNLYKGGDSCHLH